MLRQRVCCDVMQDEIDSGTVRMYDELRVGVFNGSDKRVVEIDYCPWCGRKIFFDRVWDEEEI